MPETSDLDLAEPARRLARALAAARAALRDFESRAGVIPPLEPRSAWEGDADAAAAIAQAADDLLALAQAARAAGERGGLRADAVLRRLALAGPRAGEHRTRTPGADKLQAPRRPRPHEPRPRPLTAQSTE